METVNLDWCRSKEWNGMENEKRNPQFVVPVHATTVRISTVSIERHVRPWTGSPYPRPGTHFFGIHPLASWCETTTMDSFMFYGIPYLISRSL